MDLVDPLLGRVMRRVRGPGDVVEKKGLSGINLVDPVQVVDGVVGHACDQIPARFALERIDLRRVAKQVRLPLIGVAANKPIEVLEAHADGPMIERPDLAGLEGRRVMVLAKPGSGVAIVFQDAADRWPCLCQ